MQESFGWKLAWLWMQKLTEKQHAHHFYIFCISFVSLLISASHLTGPCAVVLITSWWSQNISLLILHNKLFIVQQLSGVNECVYASNRELAQTESLVTSWPLHVKKPVVQCQWLKQRCPPVCLPAGHTNAIKRLSVLHFCLVLIYDREIACGGASSWFH